MRIREVSGFAKLDVDGMGVAVQAHSVLTVVLPGVMEEVTEKAGERRGRETREGVENSLRLRRGGGAGTAEVVRTSTWQHFTGPVRWAGTPTVGYNFCPEIEVNKGHIIKNESNLL